MMMIRDFYRFPKISDRFLIDIYRFHGMSWYFYGSYFLTIRKARFLVTSPDSPRALDWEHNDMAELPKIKNHMIWFWGWELVRIMMIFFSFMLLEKDPLKFEISRNQRFRDLAETVKPIAALNFHWGIWLVRCIFSLTGEDINFKQIKIESLQTCCVVRVS